MQKLVNEIAYLIGVPGVAGIVLNEIYGVQPVPAIAIGLLTGLVVSWVFGKKFDLGGFIVYDGCVVIGATSMSAQGQPLLVGIVVGYLVALIIELLQALPTDTPVATDAKWA